MIDGCSVFSVLRRIVLPLAGPALVAIAVFAFIFSWNELLFALFLTQNRAQTLPILVAGRGTAVAALAIVPPILFAVVAQKYIIRGLTLGAVKG